eukprot:gene3170-3640_t
MHTPKEKPSVLSKRIMRTFRVNANETWQLKETVQQIEVVYQQFCRSHFQNMKQVQQMLRNILAVKVHMDVSALRRRFLAQHGYYFQENCIVIAKFIQSIDEVIYTKQGTRIPINFAMTEAEQQQEKDESKKESNLKMRMRKIGERIENANEEHNDKDRDGGETENRDKQSEANNNATRKPYQFRLILPPDKGRRIEEVYREIDEDNKAKARKREKEELMRRGVESGMAKKAARNRSRTRMSIWTLDPMNNNHVDRSRTCSQIAREDEKLPIEDFADLQQKKIGPGVTAASFLPVKGGEDSTASQRKISLAKEDYNGRIRRMTTSQIFEDCSNVRKSEDKLKKQLTTNNKVASTNNDARPTENNSESEIKLRNRLMRPASSIANPSRMITCNNNSLKLQSEATSKVNRHKSAGTARKQPTTHAAWTEKSKADQLNQVVDTIKTGGTSPKAGTGKNLVALSNASGVAAESKLEIAKKNPPHIELIKQSTGLDSNGTNERLPQVSSTSVEKQHVTGNIVDDAQKCPLPDNVCSANNSSNKIQKRGVVRPKSCMKRIDSEIRTAEVNRERRERPTSVSTMSTKRSTSATVRKQLPIGKEVEKEIVYDARPHAAISKGYARVQMTVGKQTVSVFVPKFKRNVLLKEQTAGRANAKSAFQVEQGRIKRNRETLALTSN